MNKIRLDLESLSVESFHTSPETRAGRGTVRAHDSVTEPQEPDTIANTCECPPQGTAFTACFQVTCAWTCDPNCPAGTGAGDTCWNTCANTCYVCGPQEPQG